jgi:hypothetical protein
MGLGHGHRYRHRHPKKKEIALEGDTLEDSLSMDKMELHKS